MEQETKRWQTRHIVAVIIGVLTAAASYQSNVGSSSGQYPGWQIDVGLAALTNVALVYLVASLINWIRRSKIKR